MEDLHLRDLIIKFLHVNYKIPLSSGFIIAGDILFCLREEGRDPFDRFYREAEIVRRFGPFQYS